MSVVMIPWTKLPFSFSPELLRADLAAIPEETWKLHFNRNDFEGLWSSVSLRSRTGRADDISPQGNVEDFRDTPLMELCPNLRAAIETFQIPLKAVRLLRLHAGSRVREHSDRDLGLSDGEIRLHIPIVTNERLEFIVANRRLILNEGESWYIDFSQPHRIFNGGNTDRIHLIIDGRTNDWAMELLERSVREIKTETFEPAGEAAYAKFRELVLQDAALQEELSPIDDKDVLIDAVLAAGERVGFDFDRPVVESSFAREWHSWMMRTVEM